MSRRLSVSVGRESPGAIEAPDTFETSGRFGVDVENHGRDVRVHFSLDDDLAAVASLPDNNVRVERGESRTVAVDVEPDASRTGTLTVATGYGQEDHAVTVTVARRDTEETPVDPAPAARDDADTEGVGVVGAVADAVDRSGDTSVGLLAVAGLAVLVALAAATAVGGVAGFAGGLVLLLGVAGAGWLLLVGE